MNEHSSLLMTFIPDRAWRKLESIARKDEIASEKFQVGKTGLSAWALAKNGEALTMNVVFTSVYFL
jgi:hypothetical protein